nr:MAG TPA: hypothetical protein [Caudoviricetes sp.]
MSLYFYCSESPAFSGDFRRKSACSGRSKYGIIKLGISGKRSVDAGRFV